MLQTPTDAYLASGPRLATHDTRWATLTWQRRDSSNQWIGRHATDESIVAVAAVESFWEPFRLIGSTGLPELAVRQRYFRAHPSLTPTPAFEPGNATPRRHRWAATVNRARGVRPQARHHIIERLEGQLTRNPLIACHLQVSSWRAVWWTEGWLGPQHTFFWYRLVGGHLRLYYPGRECDQQCRHSQCTEPETIDHLLWRCPPARQVWLMWTRLWNPDPPSLGRIFQRSEPPFPARLQLEYEHWYGRPPAHWEAFLTALWKASVTILAHYIWLKRNQRVFAADDPPASTIGTAALRHLRAHLQGIGQAWILRRATKPSGTLLLRIIPILFELSPSPHPAPVWYQLSYTRSTSAAGACCVWLLTAEARPVAAGWRWSTARLKPSELLIYQALRDGARHLRRPPHGRCALEITGPSARVASHLNGYDKRKPRRSRTWRAGLADYLHDVSYRGTRSDASHLQPLLAAANTTTQTASFQWAARPASLRDAPAHFSADPRPTAADSSPLVTVSRTYTSV